MLSTVKYLCKPGPSALFKCFSTTLTRFADDLDLVAAERFRTSDIVPIERGPLPIITSRTLQFLPARRLPRQCWVENLDTVEEQKLGLIDLHPEIWAQSPRMDILHANIVWQGKYRHINWNRTPNRMEKRGSNRKPWPQKGLGKARHGSRKSPIWYHGGKAHGPRGPELHFYMLPMHMRIKGLCQALSIKFAQEDVKIVDTLEIPSTDPEYLQELAKQRHWGISVLLVDDTDLMPKNITIATDTVGHINLMPVYGLNCWSMLKHETLVLTLAAVNKLEDRLLRWLHANDQKIVNKPYKGEHLITT